MLRHFLALLALHLFLIGDGLLMSVVKYKPLIIDDVKKAILLAYPYQKTSICLKEK